MRTILNSRFFSSIILSAFFMSIGCLTTTAQNTKKNSVRIKAYYIKTMNQEANFNIKASSKVENQNIDVANIELTILNELNDEEVILGSTTTNMNGEGKFVVKDFNLIKPDSSGLYNITVSFKGNDSYKRASKSLTYRDASIEAKIITVDSINYITATLKDTAKDSLLSGKLLNVQVQRLFRPLKIGEEYNITDEAGTILVSIEEGIPGVDGKLTMEVVLKDSDDYGTVKALVNAPVGIPIVEESTFDERTMWSPRNKTPLFLLIVPNLIILGIWGIIIYLILNLIKLKKS
jgi:archaellum component FlaF (FlaF/FlaG flagellin family)